MTIRKSKSFYQSPDLHLPQMRLDSFCNWQLLKEHPAATLYSATHIGSGTKITLKCVHKSIVKKEDFLQQLQYNYYLSPHPNIINSFEEAYQTNCFYISTHEFAPEGDLSAFVDDSGISEPECKKVVAQVAKALQFMHSKGFVHQSIRLENISIFDQNMSRAKLGEFSSTKPTGKLVKKQQINNPWEPPEICEAVVNEGYYTNPAQDSWQLGILIFACLTGVYPWATADITDSNYSSWVQYQKRKTTKIPTQFKMCSPRLLRLLRRLLEPKASRRAEVQEVNKYLSDTWVDKGVNSLIISISKKYSKSFHSSPRSSLDTTSSSESSKSSFHQVIADRPLYRHHTFHN